MARPTKYNEEFHARWARSLARRGLTIAQIAKEMGVAKATLYNWMDSYQEFLDAVNEGRSYADSVIEDSLYSLARGVTVKETRRKIVYDDNGQPVPQVVDVVEKEMPPSASACIFWLKNRKPDSWRDKREIDMSETIADVKNVMTAIRTTAEQSDEDRAD